MTTFIKDKKNEKKENKPRGMAAFWAQFRAKAPPIPHAAVEFIIANPYLSKNLWKYLIAYEGIRRGDSQITMAVLQEGFEYSRRKLIGEKRDVTYSPGVGSEPNAFPLVAGSQPRMSGSDMWTGEKRLPQSACLRSKLTIGSPRSLPSKSVAQEAKMDIYSAQGTFNGEYTKAVSMLARSTGINATYNKLIPLELPAEYYRRILVSDYPSYSGSNSRETSALSMFDLPSKNQTGNSDFTQGEGLTRSTYFPMKKRAKLEITSLNTYLPMKVTVKLVQLKKGGDGTNSVAVLPYSKISNVLADVPANHRIATGASTAHGTVTNQKVYGDSGQTASDWYGSYDWLGRTGHSFHNHINFDDEFNCIWSAKYTVQPGGTRMIDLENTLSFCPQRSGNYADVAGANFFTQEQIFALVEVKGIPTPFYKVKKASNAPGPVTSRVWGRSLSCPANFTTKLDMGLSLYTSKDWRANGNIAGGIYYRKNYLIQQGETNVSEPIVVTATGDYGGANQLFDSEAQFAADTSQSVGYITPVMSPEGVAAQTERLVKT